MDAKKMGTFISEQRKQLNLTQMQLAQRLHVSDKTISKWENGYGLPDIGNLEPLANALGISLTELMICERKGGENHTEETAQEESLREALDMAQQKVEKASYYGKKLTIVSYLIAIPFFVVLTFREIFFPLILNSPLSYIFFILPLDFLLLSAIVYSVRLYIATKDL